MYKMIANGQIIYYKNNGEEIGCQKVVKEERKAVIRNTGKIIRKCQKNLYLFGNVGSRNNGYN